MTNLHKAIIYASMFGSILSEFDKSPKAIMDIRVQVKKFMYKRSRTNRKEYVEAVTIGHKVWSDAINYYAEKNLKIDSFALVVALWSDQAELLARFVNLTQKRMDRFSLINDNDLLDAELDAYEVADYINKLIEKES